MTNVNTLPPPTEPQFEGSSVQDPMLHRNFRTFVMGVDSETNDPYPLVKQIGKKLGTRPDGSDIKDYDLNTRRDPTPEETHLFEGAVRPSLDKLPDDDTWVGHFQKIPASTFEDAGAAKKYLENGAYRFSRRAARRIIELVQNRTERLLLRGKMAIAGNRAPMGVPIIGKQVVDDHTGEAQYTPGIVDLLPKASERPVSSRDFYIDIDRLESKRRTDANGKKPGEEHFDESTLGLVDIEIKDGQGRQPWERDWEPTIRRVTVPTLDEIEAYLSERHTKDTSDPRKDLFLKYPQLREEAVEPTSDETLLDRCLVRLQLKVGHSLGEMNAFSSETLNAYKNKAAIDIVNTTQSYAEDQILRAIDKFPINEHGQPVDFKTKKPIPMTDLFKREEMIHLLEHKPEILIGLFNYAKTKWGPEQIAELTEYFFDVAHEAHISDDVFIGYMIGCFYGDKLEDNAPKNSAIVHPVLRHESGPLKGQEKWKVRVDKETNEPYYEDIDGRACAPSEILTDAKTGRMYHPAWVTDKHGNSEWKAVWIKYIKKLDPDTGNRLYETNPDGSLKKVSWYTDEGGVEHFRNVPLSEPVKFMEPEYDMEHWVLGKIDLLSYVTEIGRRFRAGEFAFRESAMSALYLRVVELAEVMNASEYTPGFSESSDDALSFDDFRGRTNKAKSLGRDSEMFRIAAYSMSMLWIGLSENLKQNYGGGADDGGKDTEKMALEFQRRQELLNYSLQQTEADRVKDSPLRELDPKFYSGPAISNQFLKETVLILDSIAKRFPAIKKPSIGDTLILGPNGQGQDILPLY